MKYEFWGIILITKQAYFLRKRTMNKQKEQKMVVEYIRYTIASERQEDFIEAYSKASKQLDRSEHCLGYELTHCEEEPENFILRIEWTSTANHLNGFRKSQDFMTFLNFVKPFFNNIVEMNHYRLTKVVKKQ